MKIQELVRIFILIIALVICTKCKYDKHRPSDFSFKIINEIDSYDSEAGIYIRRYMLKDTTLKVNLTQEELNSIYGFFKKIDFMSFPNEFECAKNSNNMLPAFSTTIKITYNGQHKIVTNTDYCDQKIEQQKSTEFDEFRSVIMKILYNKDAVNGIRPCDIIFF